MLKLINPSDAHFVDEISPAIREELNGAYTLDFDAMHESDKPITPDAEVEAESQAFDIATYEQENGSKGVYYHLQCEHVTYRLIEDELEYFANSGTVSSHLSALFTGTPFTVGTVEPTGDTTISINERTNKREILFAIAQTFDGELSYDGYTVHLLNQRGRDNGSQLRIGKNLTGIRKAIDKRDKDESGNPLITYEVDVVNIAETDEYADVKDFESLQLGDTKRVIDDEIGVDASLRVVSLEYDPKDKRNLKVELSNRTKDVADDLTVIEKEKVTKDAIYNGVQVGPENGFVAERSDKKARAIFNATEGISIQTGDGTGDYVDTVYIDTDGNAKFAGDLESAGGTFNGELKVYNGNTLINEVFKDTYGGLLKLYDNSGKLNVKLGVESGEGDNQGGTLILYDDDPNDPRVALGIDKNLSAGLITLKNNVDDTKAAMGADSNAGAYVGVLDGSQSLVSFLTQTGGKINGDDIATEVWANDQFAPINHTHNYTTQSQVSAMIDDALAVHVATYHSS